MAGVDLAAASTATAPAPEKAALDDLVKKLVGDKPVVNIFNAPVTINYYTEAEEELDDDDDDDDDDNDDDDDDDDEEEEDEDESSDGARAARPGRHTGTSKFPVPTVAAVRQHRSHHRHDKPKNAAAPTATARLVCDIDLAILGSEPEKYDQYARQIRREYAWVPLDRYREGRISFLQRLLAGPGIYQTEELAYLEKPARSNVERELANLSSSV
jgi:hypothetical protein